MSERASWVKLVSTLNRLTQANKINWQSENPPQILTAGTSDQIPLYFSARHNARDLGLYEERYQTMDDYERTYWTSRVVLVFFDQDDRPIWELPGEVAGLREIFDAIRYQSSGVNDFIRSLEEDDDE